MSKVKVIAMGASTGGFDALEAIISNLPSFAPPVVVAMHLQPGISRIFASRLSGMCQLTAKQAETGDYLRPGHVLIAPGDMHMRVVNTLGGPIVECFTGARVHHTMPSADVLFSSVASALKRDAIGVLLTGIGADGARGLKDMLEAGAATIGQDKESSMVYGMSKVAKDMGAVKYELPLSDIAEKIISIFSA